MAFIHELTVSRCRCSAWIPTLRDEFSWSKKKQSSWKIRYFNWLFGRQGMLHLLISGCLHMVEKILIWATNSVKFLIHFVYLALIDDHTRDKKVYCLNSGTHPSKSEMAHCLTSFSRHTTYTPRHKRRQKNRCFVSVIAHSIFKNIFLK